MRPRAGGGGGNFFKIALIGEIFGNVRLGKFLESVRLGKFLESVRLGKLLESVRLGKFYGKKSAGAQIFDFSGRFCTSAPNEVFYMNYL
jgi:hypothetical protein